MSYQRSLKNFEAKKKLQIAKATEDARKIKKYIKECWLKQERIIELVEKLRACKTDLDLMMKDWKKLPFYPRDQRSVERKRACDDWYGSEAAKIEETLTKQGNALALDQHTMICMPLRDKNKTIEEKQILKQKT